MHPYGTTSPISDSKSPKRPSRGAVKPPHQPRALVPEMRGTSKSTRKHTEPSVISPPVRKKIKAFPSNPKPVATIHQTSDVNTAEGGEQKAERASVRVCVCVWMTPTGVRGSLQQLKIPLWRGEQMKDNTIQFRLAALHQLSEASATTL